MKPLLAAVGAAIAAFTLTAPANATPIPATQPTATSTQVAAATPTSCAVRTGTYTNFTTPQGPRKLKIYVPPGAGPGSPMIVSMHGATGTSEVQETTTGFTAIGQRENAIVVYPQSTGTSPWTVWSAAPNSFDVAFVAAATSYMHAFGCGSPATTYLNGFSMGAMMTSRLMCSHSNLYAGAAMVGGVLPPTPGCTIPPSKTIIIVHGTQDTTVPWDGSLPANLQQLTGGAALSNYPGVNRIDMGKLWQQAKGCPNPPRKDISGGAWFTDWTGCRTAPTQVFSYLYTGHTWNANPAIKAQLTSELIWSKMKPERPSAWAVPAGTTVRIATGKPGQTVFGNLTVTNAAAPGYTTAYTCGMPRPGTSTNNFIAGRTSPNFAAVKADSAGNICVYTSAMADILWDQVGSEGAATVLPVAQTRIIDTRTDPHLTLPTPERGQIVTGIFTDNAPAQPVSTVLQVSTGQPAGTLVMGNLTVTQPAASGHTTAWPCDKPMPLVSTNNFAAGQTTANFVVAPVDQRGNLCVATSAPTHLIFDIAATSPAANTVFPQVRFTDTRNMPWWRIASPAIGSLPVPASAMASSGVLVKNGETMRVKTGRPGLTLAVNSTAIGTDVGHTTVWPCDQPRPLASTNNYVANATMPVFALVNSGTSGDVCVSVVGASTHMLIDFYGAVPVKTSAPVRKVDTRLGWVRQG